MNSATYLKECLKKRLLPFIKRHHRVEDVYFWPDKAKIHYGGAVTRWLAENGIVFPEYDKNAQNVPQARPIETFWDKCKTAYKSL